MVAQPVILPTRWVRAQGAPGIAPQLTGDRVVAVDLTSV